MNQPETVDGIRIAHTKMGRVHVYTSPDLPGLYVSDRDKMVALRSIKPTIETLISVAARREEEARRFIREL